MPDQPCSVTVNTSCAANSRFSLRGTHSSSSTFILSRQERLFHLLKHLDGVRSADRRKIVKKFVQTIARFQIIEQSLHRHARPRKHRRTPKHIVPTIDQSIVRHKLSPHTSIRSEVHTFSTTTPRRTDSAPSSSPLHDIAFHHSWHVLKLQVSSTHGGRAPA